MVKVTIERNDTGHIIFFQVEGHAGYAESGRDIICAAASAVAYTAIGYFEEKYNPKGLRERTLFQERDGFLFWRRPVMRDEISLTEANAVLEAMEIGFRQIEGSYGKRFLTVYE